MHDIVEELEWMSLLSLALTVYTKINKSLSWYGSKELRPVSCHISPSMTLEKPRLFLQSFTSQPEHFDLFA